MVSKNRELKLENGRTRNSKKIGEMFSRISPRYDFLNRILSFGLDKSWRRKAVRIGMREKCQKVLDVCAGTGEMTIEISKGRGNSIQVYALDLSLEALKIAKEKVRKIGIERDVFVLQAEAEKLPFRDSEFDLITIAFGLRNVKNMENALKEFYRATKPGGCFVCLEFSHPPNPFFKRLYFFYLLKIVPLIAQLFGSEASAYQYLGNTIKNFPNQNELQKIIESANWDNISCQNLTGGIVAIHQGEKPTSNR